MENRKITLTVPEYKNETIGGKEVTLYIIKVECDGGEWELKRRYNEFDDLKKDLAKNHGGLPEMPGKTLWKVSQDDFLDKRKAGLQNFL
jgi:PX domain